MSRFYLCVALILGWGPLSVTAFGADAGGAKNTAQPAAPRPVAHGPEAAARQLWALTDLVLDNHIDPPSRQQMLLAGTKAFLYAAGVKVPVGLSRRVSGLTSEKELVAFLRSVWPKPPEGKAVAPAPSEAALVDGLLNSVPGPARLLHGEDLKVTNVLSGNRYVGTGIMIRLDTKSEYAQIVNPVRRGPARLAGARPGDLIVEINGVSAHRLGLVQIIKTLRGDAGTPVTMVVRQPGSQEKRTLKIIRREIPFDTVLGYRRLSENDWKYRADPDAPIGYLWLKGNTSSTLHELRRTERLLKAEGIRALVIDMRFSTGDGVISNAALVAGAFLDGRELWRFRNAQGRLKEVHSGRDCLFRGWPVVVLVNDAILDMASQMVAAALQDNGRAVLVGEPTKGGGYGNSLINLTPGPDVLMLRTFRVERTGSKPRGWGVQPDHIVKLTPQQRQAVQRWLGEKDLPELPANTTDTPPEDPQLAKALEVLRAALKMASK
jgi:carboxyl-terminal processing protease